MTALVYEYAVELSVRKADGAVAVVTYVGYAYSPQDACVQAILWAAAEDPTALVERAVSVGPSPRAIEAGTRELRVRVDAAMGALMAGRQRQTKEA